jgi:hypothetical protein
MAAPLLAWALSKRKMLMLPVALLGMTLPVTITFASWVVLGVGSVYVPQGVAAPL